MDRRIEKRFNITMNTLRLGTRGSILARSQSQGVADRLMAAVQGLSVELIVIQTTGDRVVDRPLYEVGGKGVFTKELELALLAGQIDFAVHSYKDVPVTLPLVDQHDLLIASVPIREDPRDVIIGASSIDALPDGATVGTSSLRRRCQLLERRPDLRIAPLRGNIDTRLRKLREGAYDAIILAAAGLKRSGMFDGNTMYPLALHEFLPSAGQGALALQCRRGDVRVEGVLHTLHDARTATCVEIERQVIERLNGDCHSPIASLVQMDESQIQLSVAVGQRDGDPPVFRSTRTAAIDQADRLVENVIADLFKLGYKK